MIIICAPCSVISGGPSTRDRYFSDVGCFLLTANVEMPLRGEVSVLDQRVAGGAPQHPAQVVHAGREVEDALSQVAVHWGALMAALWILNFQFSETELKCFNKYFVLKDFCAFLKLNSNSFLQTKDSLSKFSKAVCLKFDRRDPWPG